MSALLLWLGLASACPAGSVHEVRAVWVTRWSYHSPDEVDRIMRDLAQAGFNQVYFQVRGRFDAYYRSRHEPWARELSGTLGRDPGWDPLSRALLAAHAQGLALHAWINTYPMWSGSVPPASAGVPHAWNTHQDWLLRADGHPQPLNAGYVFADPGLPAVRQRVVTVASEIASRYRVDGVHFDYLRYPGPGWGVGDPSSKRAAIVDTIRAVQDRVAVPISAAVWGITEDKWGWHTSSGLRDYHQDTGVLLGSHALDAAVPMIYWRSNPGGRLDFGTLLADHLSRRAGRQVVAGIDANKLSYDEVVENITVTRALGADGFALFEYLALRDKGWLAKLRAGPLAGCAALPEMPWLTADSQAPVAPDVSGVPAARLGGAGPGSPRPSASP